MTGTWPPDRRQSHDSLFALQGPVVVLAAVWLDRRCGSLARGLPMIELAWVPFVVLLLCFGAFVAETWPRHDPTDDAQWERRHQAHKQ